MPQQIPISVAIVYALTEEVRPLLKEAEIGTKITTRECLLQFARFRGVDAVFCRTGMGMADAHEAAEHLLEYARPGIILSIGCAGATLPDLKTGDIILPPEIRSETPTDRFITSEPDRLEVERLLREEGIPYQIGPLMTLWQIAGSADKEEWGARGVACVDMETAAIAAIADKQNVPLLSLRAVFDPLDESFPSTEPYDEKHPLSYLLRNPKMLLRIPRYARASALCRKRLFRIVSRYVETHLPAQPTLK